VAWIGRVRDIEVRLVEALVLHGADRRRSTGLRRNLKVVAVQAQTDFGFPLVRHVDRVLRVQPINLLRYRLDVLLGRETRAVGKVRAEIAAVERKAKLLAHCLREEVLLETRGY